MKNVKCKISRHIKYLYSNSICKAEFLSWFELMRVYQKKREKKESKKRYEKRKKERKVQYHDTIKCKHREIEIDSIYHGRNIWNEIQLFIVRLFVDIFSPSYLFFLLLRRTKKRNEIDVNFRVSILAHFRCAVVLPSWALIRFLFSVFFPFYLFIFLPCAAFVIR